MKNIKFNKTTKRQSSISVADQISHTTMRSGVQFVFDSCSPIHESGDEAGECWLCGGHALDGFLLRDKIPETMTNHNRAKSPASDIVCKECVAMIDKGSWESYVDANPEANLKKGYAVSWRFYSHAAWDGHHECPKRDRWRELFISPPFPPFVFCVALSAQKQILFMSKVSHSKDLYWVQLEDESILINRNIVEATINIFESLYSAGHSKTAILSGRYDQRKVIKQGMKLWNRLEIKMEKIRKNSPNELKLAHFCAQKEDEK